MTRPFIRLVRDGGELYLKAASIHGAHYSPATAEEPSGLTLWDVQPDGTLDERNFEGNEADVIRDWFYDRTNELESPADPRMEVKDT